MSKFKKGDLVIVKRYGKLSRRYYANDKDYHLVFLEKSPLSIGIVDEIVKTPVSYSYLLTPIPHKDGFRLWFHQSDLIKVEDEKKGKGKIINNINLKL